MLEAVADLYPWKPPVVLFRALEWRGVYRRRGLLSAPMLDLGCGDGAIHRLFFGANGGVGIDVEPGPLVHAKRRMGKVVRADAEQLPFRDAAFNTLFGNCSVEHVSNLARCLAEAARVLRPGGIFMATVPSGNWKSLYCWNRFYTHLGFPRLGRKIVDAHDRKMAHYNVYDSDEWARRLRQAGLEPVGFDPYLTPAGARFTTLAESILALPFPFPGFFKPSGLFYFMVGVLRRLGGEAFWKRIFLRLVRPLYEQPVGADGIAGGVVVIAQKPSGYER